MEKEKLVYKKKIKTPALFLGPTAKKNRKKPRSKGRTGEQNTIKRWKDAALGNTGFGERS